MFVKMRTGLATFLDISSEEGEEIH